MVSAPPTRSPWPLAAALAAMLLVALVVAGRGFYFGTSVLETGDTAVNALQIDNAKGVTEIYGNYSRFGFNHPGPAFFYVYAAGEYILHDWLGVVPTPHNAHSLASLVVQVGFFALALALLDIWIGSGAFLALALLGGLWHFSLAKGSFTSVWPPHVLLMPFLCFLTAACSVAAGRVRDLAIMVVAGGMLFHGHVAQPLFVGGLGLATGVIYWRSHVTAGTWIGWKPWARAHRGLLQFCAVWTGLILLPLLVDLLRYGGESNLVTIIRRFLVNTQDGKSVLQSVLYFLSFPTYFVDQENVFTELTGASYYFFVQHGLILAGWAVVLIGPAILARRWRDRLPAPMRGFLRAAYLLWILTAGLCVAWGLVQSGPMFQFNGFFYYGVYYFLALLGLGTLAFFFTRSWTAPVLTMLLCLAAIVATWRFHAEPWNEDDAGTRIRGAVDAALRSSPAGRPKLLVFEHYAWPEAAAVALELQRRGIKFYNSASWNFMLGRRHDSELLGPSPESAADVWWVAAPGENGLTLTKNLALFTSPAPVNPHATELNFAGRANGYRHVVGGLSTGNLDYASTDQKRTAFIFTPLPAETDVQMVFDAQSNPRPDAPGDQPGEIYFNGKLLGTANVGRIRSQFIVTVPRALWNQRARAVVEVRYPQAAEFHFFSRPASHTWTAWALWNVWFATPAAAPAAAPAKSPSFVLTLEDPKAAARRPLTASLSPVDGRIDFTATGNVGNFRVTGLGKPAATMTRVIGQSASVLFLPTPTTTDVYLEIVALPYADKGPPPMQRCQVLLNGRQVFNSPFTEPGVVRAIIPRDEWNQHPLAFLQIHLPDASVFNLSGQPRQGLALRWLTVTPSRETHP
jgi:hypothetical protein